MICSVAAAAAFAALLSSCPTSAFVAPSVSSLAIPATSHFAATLSEDAAPADAIEDKKESERRRLKRALLGRLGGPSLPVEGTAEDGTSATNNFVGAFDPVLADPLTKDPLGISVRGPILGNSPRSSGLRVSLRSSADPDRIFAGRTNTYINLLEPTTVSSSSAPSSDDAATAETASSPILSSLLTFAPPPVRSIIANTANNANPDLEYVPMRDLFTSPSVSFAYERGWRQGFAAAGFPGADEEFRLATEYFGPVIEGRKDGVGGEGSVLVDMSCATGEWILSPHMD